MFTRYIALVFILANVYSQVHGTNFTDQELAFFATLDLCNHFGGACNATCPHRFIRHRWGIPLCPVNGPETLECCLGPPEDDEEGQASTMTTTTPAPTTTTTTTTTTTAAPEFATCGLAQPSTGRRRRIVGGRVAARGRWPWIVALRSMLGSHACAGAVVAQRWVVTAAHCFKYVSNPSLWRVRVGEYNLLQADVGERDLHIQEIILHPGYTARLELDQHNGTGLYTKYLHDLALIRLAQDSMTQPICLPVLGSSDPLPPPTLPSDTPGVSLDIQPELSNQIRDLPYFRDTPTYFWRRFRRSLGQPSASQEGEPDPQLNEIPDAGFVQPSDSRSGYGFRQTASGQTAPTTACWVAGWGSTRQNESDETQDQVLHEVPGTLVDTARCSHMWNTSLQENMLCFGDGTHGPCNGDSGGPLACETDGRFYLTGVVSWGTEACDVAGYPSVFTRLRSYLPWIRSHLHNHTDTALAG